MSQAAPNEYVIRTCPLLTPVKLDNVPVLIYCYFATCHDHFFSLAIINHYQSVPFHDHKITWFPICYNEIAGAHPNMNTICCYLLHDPMQYHMWHVKRICVFEHSVMTNFNCACPAIQWGQGSGFLSESSSWFTACMSKQRRFWRDCADVQARLNLRCSHRR